MRAVPCGKKIYLDDLENMKGVQSLLSTERQRVFDEVIRLVERKLEYYGLSPKQRGAKWFIEKENEYIEGYNQALHDLLSELLKEKKI